ncbi:SRPBCC family protein [Nocardioides insulae]|uniref:SRPBCC family protein n=1 Tax=Nocardioides insulae TaxID=394734 RepID=UPI0004007C9A|nr:SRPBCC family protein [Nocardioides insulae]
MSEKNDATGSLLEASIEIEAPQDAVWAMITDVTRMSSWSPQVVRTVVFGGPLRRGTRFLNLNRQGWKHWPTNARVVRFTPHRDFAFRIAENHSIWSFELTPTETGTRVTQRRETPEGTSLVSRTLVRIALGGQEPFSAEMLAGMRETLGRLKVEAEGGVSGNRAA